MKKIKYDEGSIDVHLNLDGVRHSPQVYISAPDNNGMLLIAKEPIQNCFDEANLEEVKTKAVIVSLDGEAVWVADAGRGIPIGIHKTTKISTLTTIMTTLSAGGKMRSGKDAGYSKATAGCFVYDQKIELLNGKKVAIGKLAEKYEKTGKKFWVYSNAKNGKYMFQPAQASAFPTKIVTELAIVTLDNDEVVKCTIDHPFYRVNGKTVKAKDLKPKDSLMSLSLKEDKDGYYYYWDKIQNKRVRVNRAVADMCGQDIENKDVHHINRDKKDNRPHMLKALNRWTHSRIDPIRNKKISFCNTGIKRQHLAEGNKGNYKENQQKGKIARCITTLVFKNLEINEVNYNKYRVYAAPIWGNFPKSWIKELISKAKINIKTGFVYALNGKKYSIEEYTNYTIAKRGMTTTHTSEMSKKRIIGKILKVASSVIATKNLNEKNYEKFRYKINKACPTYKNALNMFSSKQNLIDQATAYNHKVVNVKIIKVKPTQVYGLTVTPNHNYLLGAGVFVKNTHGMGISITNALSKELDVWTFRDNNWYTQSYSKGKVTTPVKKVKSPPKIPNIDKKLLFKQGTIVRFVADPTVFFKGAKLETSALKEFLDLSSYILAGIKIHFFDGKKQITYYQPKGLSAYLDKQIDNHKVNRMGKVFQHNSSSVDLALCWTDYPDEDIKSYVNGVPTPEHGTHVNGLNQTLMEVLSPFKLKKHKFKSDDLRSGLICVLNVQVMQPKFTTQNKIKLSSEGATEVVKNEIKKELTKFFAANKTLARNIIQRASDLAEVQQEFKENKALLAKANTKKKGKLILPEKLKTARTKNPLEKELFIVEGDSAAGTCPQARDNWYQEILALKGKPLNVFRNKPGKIAANSEIISISQAIGYSGKNSNYRIGKVILLADADPDGDHISILISGIMYKMFRHFIDNGNMYVVDGSNLFTTQVGTKRYYAETRAKLLEKLPENKRDNVNVTRLKGLGEAEPDLLEELAFNTNTRKLKRVVGVKQKGLKKFLSVVGSDSEFRQELLNL